MASLSTSVSDTFWGLGDRWWMQIIDGKDHRFGPLVYDKNLNGGGEEPNYFKGIEKAAQFAAKHFHERLTVDFYQKLHESTYAGVDPKSYGGVLSGSSHSVCPLNVLYDWKSAKWTEDQCDKRIKELNGLIAQKSKKIGATTPVTRLKRFEDRLMIIYGDNEDDKKTLVENAFAEFNQQIEKAESPRQKKKLIADLYQTLEWIHPFIDHQTRTDLILLAKLLSEHESNPSILTDPYVSSVATLDEWTAYLDAGIEKWREINLS